MKNNDTLTTLSAATTDGNFIASYSVNGLARLRFPSKQPKSNKQVGNGATATIRKWHRMTESALKRTLSGKDTGALPPLDLSEGTDFQQRVWKALGQIRSGRTQSYGEVAKQIGKVKAVRAVGGACGANPIPVLIPCHRVLAANRKLGGFSGGLDWKRTLLAREGVKLG